MVENVPAPYVMQRSIASHATSRSHRVPNYCAHGSMPLLSADGRHWHHRQQGGERSKCLRSSLSCKASAVPLQTHASFAPPLRLSGEPPDSRRGGAVTFNLSRCASCEGARESRGSHAAGLNEGWRWGAYGEVCILGLGIFGEGVLTRCPRGAWPPRSWQAAARGRRG